MKFSIALSCALALTTSGCFFGRPNKQIDKLEHKKDGSGETTFKYDDDGFLTEVERDYGEGERTTWELEWEDGLLVQLEVNGGDGGKYEVEHDDQGRPETISGGTDATDTEIEFAYDDAGRLESYVLTSSNAELDVEQKAEIEIQYDDAGAMEEVVSTQTAGGEDYETTTTYKFDGTRVTSTTTENDTYESETEYAYDDSGRPETATTTSSYDGEDSESESETEYAWGDDGFLESFVETDRFQGEVQSETETEISYNDADARGVDMAPSALGILFDLKGGTYNRLADTKTQITRFLLQW